MQEIKFTIPKRLPSWNTFWVGLKHWQRTELKNSWRVLTLASLPEEYDLFTEPVVIQVTSYAAHTPADASNLCIKPMEDTLIDRLLMSDGWKYVYEVRLRSRKCAKEAQERTEVHIWEFPYEGKQ